MYTIALVQIGVQTAKDVAGIKTATALGIAAAMAASPLTLGMPWAGAIAAQGAVNVALSLAVAAMQAAAVAAQPLPAYKDGTKDHKGGLAIVGDGGKSELIQHPDGSLYKTPNIPTLVDLPKHSIVMADYEKAMVNMSVINHKEGMQPIIIAENKRQVALAEQNNKLMKAFIKKQSKPINSNIITRLNNKY